MHRLVLELTCGDDVEREWREHLSRGGAFVRGADLEPNEPCVLALIAPGVPPIELPARAVFRSPDGVGVQLDGFDAALRVQLEAWCRGPDDLDAPTTRDLLPALLSEELDPPTTRVQPGMPVVRFGAPSTAAAPVPVAAPVSVAASVADADLDADLDLDADADLDLDADADADADAEPDPDADEPLLRDPVARNVFERLRNLPVAQQLKVAREGELHERVALERMYGKTVWEAILRSSRVTHPEVARIARMGALPRPLIELIVGTTAWLRSPEVRRALLTNKRLAPDQITRVLRLLPKHELRLVPVQTAYPLAVRDVARKLLKAEVGA